MSDLPLGLWFINPIFTAAKHGGALSRVNFGLYLVYTVLRYDEENMTQDPGMREITRWWDEFCRSADTKQELLGTAIGREVRRRIFEVRVSDKVVDLFDKLETVFEFYLSLTKKVRSTEMWRLMLFWSMLSVILWADYAEAGTEVEELPAMATGNAPEPASTYH